MLFFKKPFSKRKRMLKFVRQKTDFYTLSHDRTTQIVQIMTNIEWKKEHHLFAVHFTPIDFKDTFEKKLDQTKKIILFGPWRKNVSYYRLLKAKGYDVFLTEDYWWETHGSKK